MTTEQKAIFDFIEEHIFENQSSINDEFTIDGQLYYIELSLKNGETYSTSHLIDDITLYSVQKLYANEEFEELPTSAIQYELFKTIKRYNREFN